MSEKRIDSFIFYAMDALPGKYDIPYTEDQELWLNANTEDVRNELLRQLEQYIDVMYDAHELLIKRTKRSKHAVIKQETMGYAMVLHNQLLSAQRLFQFDEYKDNNNNVDLEKLEIELTSYVIKYIMNRGVSDRLTTYYSFYILAPLLSKSKPNELMWVQILYQHLVQLILYGNAYVYDDTKTDIVTIGIARSQTCTKIPENITVDYDSLESELNRIVNNNGDLFSNNTAVSLKAFFETWAAKCLTMSIGVKSKSLTLLDNSYTVRYLGLNDDDVQDVKLPEREKTPEIARQSADQDTPSYMYTNVTDALKDLVVYYAFKYGVCKVNNEMLLLAAAIVCYAQKPVQFNDVIMKQLNN